MTSEYTDQELIDIQAIIDSLPPIPEPPQIPPDFSQILVDIIDL